jgi:hypothetical protein
MSAATTTSDLPKPSRSGRLLALVQKLIDYAAQLAATIRALPADADTMGLLCQFRTTDIALILARIKQGLLRAGLLQEKIARAAPRLDVELQPKPMPSPRAPSCEARPPSPKRTQAAPNPALANLPTAKEIAEKVRTQPIGRVLADVCRDLGLYPAHPLWREIGLAVDEFGGSWLRVVMEHLNRPFPMAHFAAWLEAERAAEPASKSTGPPLVMATS